MWANPFCRYIAVVLCICAISGCGFKLRGQSALPADLQNLIITSDNSESALFHELQKQLSKIRIEPTAGPQPELKLLADKLTRRTLSLFPNGQVAEYELIYSVSYKLFREGKEPHIQSFELTRNYQDDPDNALAKSREMTLILSEMRTQASHLIIRQLGQH